MSNVLAYAFFDDEKDENIFDIVEKDFNYDFDFDEGVELDD